MCSLKLSIVDKELSEKKTKALSELDRALKWIGVLWILYIIFIAIVVFVLWD